MKSIISVVPACHSPQEYLSDSYVVFFFRIFFSFICFFFVCFHFFFFFFFFFFFVGREGGNRWGGKHIPISHI